MKFINLQFINKLLIPYNLKFTDKQIKTISIIFGSVVIIGIILDKLNIALILAAIYVIILVFMNRRNAKYEYYAVSCTIQATDYGDIVILSVLAIYDELIVSYTPVCYIPRYFLKENDTYNFIDYSIYKLKQIDETLIVFDNLYDTFDQAIVAMYSFKVNISTSITNNIIQLRAKEEKILFNAKKASRFFAIFRK